MATSAPVSPLVPKPPRKPTTVWGGPLERIKGGVALSEAGDATAAGSLCKKAVRSNTQWPLLHAELVAFAESQGITKDGEAFILQNAYLLAAAPS